MKNFTQKFIGLLALVFAMSFAVNSQSIVSLPAPEYPITLMDYPWCDHEFNANVYIRITDENGVRLNQNTWNGASLEHTLSYGFPNESMSSFEISPGTYNYYVEALSYGDCATATPHWAILLGEDTIVSGEGIYGLEGSFVVEEPEIYGCTDSTYLEYNSDADIDDGSCDVLVVYGCWDPFMSNHNPDANTDDGSCIPHIWGCTDVNALNYNEEATADDGLCIDPILGCMESSMSNYNSEANTDDGSCVSWEELANNLQSELDNVVPEDGVSQADVDAAFADGAASVEIPECEEVATQNMPLDLPQGWSMFGYTCLESLDVVEAFSGVSDNIEIVKDEWGLAYLPAWGFSAFSNLEFGEGYQIKMIEEVTDFQFCTTIAGGASQDELDAAIAEVHAMYEGWCESDLDNDGICDVDEVSGCMDASSCNYVSEAEFDDGLCDYESCLDECGVINGDNSSCTDACGVINGDNSTCMDECATNVCLFLTPDGRLMYDSAEDIGGFEFSVGGPGGAPVAPGIFFVDASGGASADAGFTILNNGSSVIGFSFSGAIIPAGSGTLLVLEISDGYPFCLSDLIMVGQDGSLLTFSVSCEF